MHIHADWFDLISDLIIFLAVSSELNLCEYLVESKQNLFLINIFNQLEILEFFKINHIKNLQFRKYFSLWRLLNINSSDVVIQGALE